MKYSSRFWLYAPLAMFLALAGWAMAHWWIVATAFDKKLNALNGHEAIPGVTMSYATKTISGFPFNIDVVFTGFRIAGAAHGPFAWSSERFALHRLTYGRTQDIYEAAGQQSLSWTGGDGKPHGLDFLPGSLHASAITDGRGLRRFDLDLLDAGGKDSVGAPFTVGRAQFHMRRDPTLDVMVSLDDARTGEQKIHALRAYATLTRSASLASLLAGAQSWPDADAAWLKGGGRAQAGKREPAGAAGLIDAILSPLY